MEWLNIHVSTLDSPAFVRATPTDRATWLCLLRYCAGQENGGRIEGAALWGDGTWQQVARVKLREIQRACELWRWDGQALVMSLYPREKEQEVQAKRKGGKLGAEKRWAGRGGDSSANGSSDRIANSSANGSAIAELYAEGKGREGKGNGRESPLPPRGVEALAPASPMDDDVCAPGPTERPSADDGMPAEPVDRAAPTTLQRRNRQGWAILAREHGSLVANRAHAAACRIYGALYTPNQLAALVSATHRAGKLGLPDWEWPDPTASDKAAAVPDDLRPSGGELTDEQRRLAEEIEREIEEQGRG